MTVRREQRRAGARLVIDIVYENKSGAKARYRKDAAVQSIAAARAEERRLLALIAQYGEPTEPADSSATEPKLEMARIDSPAAPSAVPVAAPADPLPAPTIVPQTSAKTFGDVVEEYRATFMLTDLKVTTRRGYTKILEHALLPRFAHLPISQVNNVAAAALDLAYSKQKRKQGTRNNVQIVLRSVFRFAVWRGYLASTPTGLPRLKRIGQSILEIPSDDQVAAILAASNDSQRRSFALMAYAGLRPNEVRALRRRAVRLRWENDEPVGGFVSVREGWSHGTLHTPKTGQREVPIPPLLARELGSIESAPRDAIVAVTRYGKPWGQFGLDQAFERVRNRIGLSGWSVYCLRHYAITSWLRAGIPVHVVQRMAGHTNLSTTQRYVHHLKEDLDDAALRLARFAERLEEARGNAFGNDRGNGHGNSVETEGPKREGKRGR